MNVNKKNDKMRVPDPFMIGSGKDPRMRQCRIRSKLPQGAGGELAGQGRGLCRNPAPADARTQRNPPFRPSGREVGTGFAMTAIRKLQAISRIGSKPSRVIGS